MEELKRCPFCGCHGVSLAYAGNPSMYYVTCKRCGTAGPDGPTEEHAIHKWNRVSEKVYENHGNDRLNNTLERIAATLESQMEIKTNGIYYVDTSPIPHPEHIKITPEYVQKLYHVIRESKRHEKELMEKVRYLRRELQIYKRQNDKPTPPDQVKTPEWTGKMTF